MSSIRLRRGPSFTLLALAGAAVIGAWSFGARAGSESRVVAPQQAVIALVDLERVMNGIKEVQDLNAQVAAETEVKNKELGAMDDRLKKIDEDMKLLPVDSKERRALVVQGIELQKSYEAKANIYKQLISIQNAELMRDTYLKVQGAIEKIAQKSGYTLVLLDDRAITLPKTTTDREMNAAILSKQILFASPTMDVTDEVITLMNNDYTAGGKK